jgi:hypothetical protein
MATPSTGGSLPRGGKIPLLQLAKIEVILPLLPTVKRAAKAAHLKHA